MKKEGKPAQRVFKVAIASVFAAIVCVVTLVFIVNIPATNGYFNVGETMIYVAALLFGPLIGAFAGGVGASIADLLVAPVFAPGTLVIKACEGTIVGFLSKRFGQTSKSVWRNGTILLGIFVGVLLGAVGSIYYQNVDLYLGYPTPQTPTFSISIPVEFWYAVGGIVALAIALMGLRLEAESGRAVLAILIGGLEMVAGYFLYEQLVLGETVAAVEIAANIGQMLVGLIVAIPIVRIVTRRLPQSIR